MNFQQYESYSATDFIDDEDFIRWVVRPKSKDHLFWKSFLANYPQKKEEVEEARAMVRTLAEKPAQTGLSDTEKQEMLQQMKRQIQGVRREDATASKTAGRMSRRRFTRVAAVAAVLICLATWALLALLSNDPMVTQKTAYGEQRSIELPDGSFVRMNANSTLRYSENWNAQENRTVWLQGEAFFTVDKKQESGQKFRVITKDLTVEVLGTVFNVNSHQEQTKVFLEEGQVKLDLKGISQPMFMDPGELVAYNEVEQQLPEKVRVAPKEHTSWKDGLLEFEQTPLSSVLEKLNEIYGVNIQVKDPSNLALKITTLLPLGNLDEALQVLDLTMVELEISKQANDYVID